VDVSPWRFESSHPHFGRVERRYWNHALVTSVIEPCAAVSPSVRPMTYNARMASKTERLSLRLTPTQDTVLRRAAEARGESTSDYVLRHAVEAAELDLADRRVFAIDDAAWNQLQGLLSATPSQLPPAMTRLLSQPSVLERPTR
jgi:uncharacterized protein (DUF1778 family)